MDQWVQKRAVALFAYNSGVDMDLVMDEGDPILVTGVENDEWWNGKNLSTKKFGSFPKEFVRLVPDPFAEAVGELAATTSSPTDVNSETNPFARDAPAATARSISQPESESAGTRFIMPAPETETRTVTERINPDGSRSIVTTITKKVLTTVTKPNTHSAQIPTPAATPPKVTTTAPKPPPKLTTTTTPGVRPPMPPRPVGHGTASSWAPTVDDVITRLESIKTVRAHGKDKLVWTPDQFVAIDLYCKNSPAGVNHDMDKLVNYLSAFPGEKTQLNKLRTVYAWVCTHIEYDVAGYLSGKFGGNDPLKTGTAVCAGYSKLFRDLSHALGVTEVIVIEGSGRGAGSAPGDPCIDPYDHAWNAVLLENGEHRFIESTWGATNLATRKFTYNFTNQWFLMKPKDFIYTHFPENPQYQYLESPISVDEYLSLPYMPDASAFDIHYKMIAPRGDSMLSVLDADPKTNEVYVEISVPIHTIDVDGFDVSASMFMPCQMLPPARPTNPHKPLVWSQSVNWKNRVNILDRGHKHPMFEIVHPSPCNRFYIWRFVAIAPPGAEAGFVVVYLSHVEKMRKYGVKKGDGSFHYDPNDPRCNHPGVKAEDVHRTLAYFRVECAPGAAPVAHRKMVQMFNGTKLPAGISRMVLCEPIVATINADEDVHFKVGALFTDAPGLPSDNLPLGPTGLPKADAFVLYYGGGAGKPPVMTVMVKEKEEKWPGGATMVYYCATTKVPSGAGTINAAAFFASGNSFSYHPFVTYKVE